MDRADDQPGDHQDAFVARLRDRLLDLRDVVLRLVDVGERERVEGLQPDEHRAAAAVVHQLQQLAVGDDVEGEAGPPAHIERLQGQAQLAEVFEVAREVVVVEDDQAPLPARHPGLAQRGLAGKDVAHHALHRAQRVPRADRRERAEVAGERAAARGLERQREELLARNLGHARHRHQLGVVARGAVARLQAVSARVFCHARYRVFRVADDHGVEPRRAQVRIGAGHAATEHGLRAAAAEVVADLARPVEVGMHAGEEHQVVALRPVRVFPGVVDDLDLAPVGQQRGDQRPDLRLQPATVMRAPTVVVGEHGDDADAHGGLSRD